MDSGRRIHVPVLKWRITIFQFFEELGHFLLSWQGGQAKNHPCRSRQHKAFPGIFPLLRRVLKPTTTCGLSSVWNMCLPCSSFFPCPFLCAGAWSHDHGYGRIWGPSRGVQTAFWLRWTFFIPGKHCIIVSSKITSQLESHADDAEAYWWKGSQVLSCRKVGVHTRPYNQRS